MVDLQIWLVRALVSVPSIGAFMRTAWAWPLAESVHFIGLTMLVGAIGPFDLHLLGFARSIPAAALHRLAPYGIAGFVLCTMSGLLFLMTEPDQYLYNPSFHLKVAFMIAAGVNAGLFYSTAYRAAIVRGGSPRRPPSHAWFGFLSLVLWMLVLVTGRLLTFYRPFPCEPGIEAVIATCIPRP